MRAGPKNDWRPYSESGKSSFAGVTTVVTSELLADIAAVRKRASLPLYLGSGVTDKNLKQFHAVADGFIVGSHFKKDGVWSGAVDPRRVDRFMAAHRRLDG